MLTRLKKNGSAWFAPILWGIGGTGLIAIALFSLRLLLIPPPEVPEHITTSNIEAHVRAWADTFGLSVRREPDNPDAFFTLTVTLQDTNPVTISRIRIRDHYLSLRSQLTVSPEHVAIISRLSETQNTRLIDEVAFEMARSKMGNAIIGPPLRGVIITKSVPINDGLSESVFAANVDEMDSSINLAREAIRLALTGDIRLSNVTRQSGLGYESAGPSKNH